MANEFARNIQDAALTATKALPAANASATTDAFRIGSGRALENVELEVSVPATPSLADDKKLTVELVTGSTSSPSTVKQQIFQLTGAGGAGAAATTKRVRVPSDCLEYIAVKATVDASGGDNTAVSLTAKLLH